MSERRGDGFPESLEEDVRRYGLRSFKVKLCGDPQRDLRRLRDVAAVLDDVVEGAWRFTVDANESYTDLESLASVLDELVASRGDRDDRELLYVEQPLPRGETFSGEDAAKVRNLSRHAPVLIDEADFGVDAFKRSLTCGYRGVSAKNCKGVFRALLNRGICDAHGDGAFQSAEDLTCLPVVGLQQDLATLSAFGLSHSERNGHHYFPGGEHLTAGEAASALRAHPDLYVEGNRGLELDIRDGRLALGSLRCVGFGYDTAVDFEGKTPFASWSSSYAEGSVR